MRVFLTGGTGAVGRPALRLLVEAGHEVTALVRSPERAAQAGAAGAAAAECSLFDRPGLAAAMAGHDAVINLATAIPGVVRASTPGGWAENDRVRREGSAAVAGAAADAAVTTLVQESIVYPYEDAGDAWVDEESPWRPESYAATVDDAEGNCRGFESPERRAVVLRYAMFYGPTSSHSLLFRRMLRLRLSPLVGDPDGHWSMIHVEDAASAAVAALGLPSGTYNVADDWPATRRTLASAMARAQGIGGVRFLPRLLTKSGTVAALTRSLRVSNGKLKEHGWAPRYPTVAEGWPTVLGAGT